MAASVAPTRVSQPIRAVIAVSRRKFIALWWLLQSLHVAFIAYSTSVIMLHRFFIINREAMIAYLGSTVIGFFDAVIVSHSVLIMCHCWALLRSVGWSLYYRQWRFGMAYSSIKAATVSDRAINTGFESTAFSDESQTPAATRFLQRCVHDVRQAWLAVFGRYGIFGVEGTYYESSFFALEVVEIALQIFQTYKLSFLVPRVWINRLNTVVLILNCWSTAFVHQFLHGDRLTKRVVLLAVDGIFDVMSSMVIPLVIIYPYYEEYDVSKQDFPLINYYSDVWFIQAVSENRQIFVTSWIDFISKLVPGVTVFVALFILKQYVIMDSSPSTNASTINRPVTIVPSAKVVSVLSTSTTETVGRGTDRGSNTENVQHLTTRVSKYDSKWQHLLLFLSGLAVLAVHIHSTTVATLYHTRGCLLGVRPWLTTLTTCIALEINCANGEFADGSDLAALNAHVEKLVPSALKSLVFASCSQLHVPSVVQQFRGLQMIKIYNSTVVEWDTTAELREDSHPDMQLLYVSDSNFSRGGELPAGLLGDEFPSTLVDIEFSGTNVVNLPSNLHEIWPPMQYFVLERNTEITEYPEVLVKMKPLQVFLSSNGITRIPDGLLADQAFWTISFNGNPLQALPDTVGDVTALEVVEATDADITELPRWAIARAFDAASDGPNVPIGGHVDVFAGKTPLCDDPQKREVANATKWDWVHFHCFENMGKYAYPIEEERAWRAASLANMK